MIPETRKEVLIKVRDEILTSPEKWTKHSNARDSIKTPVTPTDESATCFCLVGALYKALDINLSTVTAEKRIVENNTIRYLESIVGTNISYFNDHIDTTFIHIQDLLNIAIEGA